MKKTNCKCCKKRLLVKSRKKKFCDNCMGFIIKVKNLELVNYKKKLGELQKKYKHIAIIREVNEK